jgi:hypothetical protein
VLCPLLGKEPTTLTVRHEREAVDPVIAQHMATSLPGADLGRPGTKVREGSGPVTYQGWDGRLAGVGQAIDQAAQMEISHLQDPP